MMGDMLLFSLGEHFLQFPKGEHFVVVHIKRTLIESFDYFLPLLIIAIVVSLWASL